MYLLSLYSKSEIIEMYKNLRVALIAKIVDPKLKDKMEDLIQTFIVELNSYKEITKYRVYKNNNKFFIWEIDPLELSLGYNGDCISSDLFINIKTGEEVFDKTGNDNYYKALNFNQYEDYAEDIKKKISDQTNKKKYIKYKNKYLKLKNIYFSQL